MSTPVDIRSELTFQQFVEAVHRPPLEKDASSISGSYEFTGSHSYEESLRMLDAGWPEGAADLQSLKLANPACSEAFTFQAHYAETGDTVDISRYLDGEPECMVDYRLSCVQAPGRIVKVVMSIGASVGITREQMIERGRLSLALIDALEQSGYRIDLWIGDANQGLRPLTKQEKTLRTRYFNDAGWSRARILDYFNRAGVGTDDFRQTLVQIKEPDQPVDLDRLAFVLAHPSFFRRLIFRLKEQHPEHVRDRFWCNGSQAVIRLPNDTDAVVSPSMSGDALKPDGDDSFMTPIRDWFSATEQRFLRLDTAQA